jgi:hypothetical protein
MPRVLLILALVSVLGSATFVSAQQGLQEPAFPGGNAGEGDEMTYEAPVDAEGVIWKTVIASLLRMASFYR